MDLKTLVTATLGVQARLEYYAQVKGLMLLNQFQSYHFSVLWELMTKHLKLEFAQHSGSNLNFNNKTGLKLVGWRSNQVLYKFLFNCF